MSFAAAQEYMQSDGIDAWLCYDFRGSNAAFAQLLPGKRSTTRRAALLIPAVGEALLCHHGLDGPSFADVSLPRATYLGWRDWRTWLEGALSGKARVAMEYSPGCALPVVSMVDAGTVALVRSLGVEVVSSANLVQACVARWSPRALEQHILASKRVAEIKDRAFAMIRDRLGAGKTVFEHTVAAQIRADFQAAGLEWPDGPIVAVNAHSGDPHYEPAAEHPTPIQRGDWVMIDLWARVPGDENVHADITWMGFVGRQVPPRNRAVYEVVKAARDAALERARAGWRRKERVEGWQLDEAARQVIIDAGFGEAIKHRTGHSLSPGPRVHGIGMNLDNLETHDTREMLPGIGFTIEPGVYLPEFGVRLEIDVYVDPSEGPRVTSCIQDEIVLVD